MKIGSNRLYSAYLVGVFMLVASILVTPLLAHSGQNGIASFIYNAYIPTCHQWIYRSSCVFDDGEGMWIDDCIDESAGPVISTEFTAASHMWDGPFGYSRDQIGLNRAERVEYPKGMIGYKFPNDTRNVGIYLSMLVAGVILPFAWRRPYVPHVAWLLLAILPLAVDGTGQLLGFWESTNSVRFLTGTFAGIGSSVYIYAMIGKFRI